MAPSEQIRRIAKNDLGIDVNLNQHPEFDKNLNASVPGEDIITNSAIRTDYRRIYDEQQTSDRVISDVKSKLALKIIELNERIIQFGRN